MSQILDPHLTKPIPYYLTMGNSPKPLSSMSDMSISLIR